MQPGLIIDPLRVVSVLRREAWEYGGAVTTHPNLTTGFLNRRRKLLAWLWLAVPSPFVGVAILASAIAILGLVVFVRQQPRLSAVGCSLFAALLFEMATHRLVIVRHYLVFVPVMAVGSGHGIAWLGDRLRTRPWVWRVALAAFGVAFLVQERWLSTPRRPASATATGGVHRRRRGSRPARVAAAGPPEPACLGRAGTAAGSQVSMPPRAAHGRGSAGRDPREGAHLAFEHVRVVAPLTDSATSNYDWYAS